MLLLPEEYLRVYPRSIKDGDRVSVRRKKDCDKSKLIEEKLLQKNKRSFDRQKLYRILTMIPRGRVITYGRLAELLGDKRFARAVGNALHVNPDGDRYPCYKVVNSKGELSCAYAFGGMDEQKRRLEAEGISVEKGRVDLKRYGYDEAYHSLEKE